MSLKSSAVRFNFKSDLAFYTVPTNQNRRYQKIVYRDSILKPVVKELM